MKCMSIPELMSGLWINTSNNCDKNIARINAVLRKHYANLVGSHVTRSAIGFTGSWDQDLVTNDWNDIYKVLGIYVEMKPCYAVTKCHREVRKCDNCSLNRYTITPKRALFDDSDTWSYAVSCDKLLVNVWDNVERWYIEYSRGPKEITSMDDKICIDPLEIEMLQMSLLRAWSEQDKDYQLAEYYEQREFNARNRMQNDIENRIPDSAGFWYIPK